MKPKNKFQRLVVELSKQLPSLTQTQKDWAYRHCFEHIGRRTAKGIISCTECGYEWKDKDVSGKSICPYCGTKLNVTDTKKRTFGWNEYYGIITTFQGYQVLRYFFISAHFRAGEKAQYICNEVVQRWIAPDGKHSTLARLRGMSSMYYDLWNMCSPLEIRTPHRAHHIYPAQYYPRPRVIPELKRNGFTGDYCDLHPFEMFHTLLSDSRAETLLKAGQTQMFKYLATTSYRNIDTYWASIRICIRNGYKITDPSVWCDYVDSLAHFGKDIHNPKYVCPENLTTEHDRYMHKHREERRRTELEKNRQKAAQEENRYKEMKAKFFGIAFTDGTIQVRVLESVQEFMEEGDEMRHCVFDSAYYLKENSLILSATINGQRIETIEVALDTMHVVQSRGVRNASTEYHNRIVNLVNKNKNLIHSRIAA